MNSFGLRTALLAGIALTLRAGTLLLPPPSSLVECSDSIVVDDSTACTLSRNATFAYGA